MRCCGWSTPWEVYKRSYKGKRIHGGRAYEFFLAFMDEWLCAKGAREKMLAIDRVIHALHESANQVWTLPASVNLIEGSFEEVIAFERAKSAAAGTWNVLNSYQAIGRQPPSNPSTRVSRTSCISGGWCSTRNPTARWTQSFWMRW